jgi:hypothetical protein
MILSFLGCTIGYPPADSFDDTALLEIERHRDHGDGVFRAIEVPYSTHSSGVDESMATGAKRNSAAG